MEVIVTKRFAKDLKSKPKALIKAVDALISLLENAEDLPFANLDITRISGQKPHTHYYRIRIRDWRIGIEYFPSKVFMLRVLVRGEMYKHFPPK